MQCMAKSGMVDGVLMCLWSKSVQWPCGVKFWSSPVSFVCVCVCVFGFFFVFGRDRERRGVWLRERERGEGCLVTQWQLSWATPDFVCLLPCIDCTLCSMLCQLCEPFNWYWLTSEKTLFSRETACQLTVLLCIEFQRSSCCWKCISFLLVV